MVLPDPFIRILIVGGHLVLLENTQKHASSYHVSLPARVDTVSEGDTGDGRMLKILFSTRLFTTSSA